MIAERRRILSMRRWSKQAAKGKKPVTLAFDTLDVQSLGCSFLSKVQELLNSGIMYLYNKFLAFMLENMDKSGGVSIG